MEGELKIRREGSRCGLLIKADPLPPPLSHASPGAILARPILLPPPSHSAAWPVTSSVYKSPPLSVQLLNGHAHEVPRGCLLKEETKMNNFLLHSSLIEVLGAEQSAPKDRQKLPGPRCAQRIWHPQRLWQAVPVQQAGTVWERRGP
jgi:hypothetical protein